MLYDTGSSVTCMNADQFSRLKDVDIVAMKNARSNVVFASASGDPITATQKPIIKFEMLGRVIQYPLYIVDRLHVPFILGIDFIADNDLGYCPKHQEFYWSGNCPKDHVVSLGLKEAVTIPAMGRRRCKVRMSNQGWAGRTVVASIKMNEQPWIRGGPMLTDVDEHGDIWVEINNASPIQRELSRWDEVGHAEECEVICQLDEAKLRKEGGLLMSPPKRINDSYERTPRLNARQEKLPSICGYLRNIPGYTADTKTTWEDVICCNMRFI